MQKNFFEFHSRDPPTTTNLEKYNASEVRQKAHKVRSVFRRRKGTRASNPPETTASTLHQSWHSSSSERRINFSSQPALERAPYRHRCLRSSSGNDPKYTPPIKGAFLFLNQKMFLMLKLRDPHHSILGSVALQSAHSKNDRSPH